LSALKRADVFVLTKIDPSRSVQALSSKLQEINPAALIVESRYKSSGVVDVFGNEVLAEDFLRGKKVAGFCAIGDPVSFESELRNTGAAIVRLFTYMDHHVYQKNDIQSLVSFAIAQDTGVLVTTHKDAVKLRGFKDLFGQVRLVYIPIQLEITKGSDEFIQKIVSVRRR